MVAVRRLLGLSLLASTYAASSFNLDSSDPTSVNSLAFLGTAAYNSAGSYVLTQPLQNEVGAIWVKDPVNVAVGFSTTFKFRITHSPDTAPADGSCVTPPNAQTADGIAFVINAAGTDKIGQVAQQLGYNFENNIAFEFDTYQNTDFADNADFSVSLQSCGTSTNSASHTATGCEIGPQVAIPQLCYDGVIHTAVFTYAPTSTGGVVTVVYDGQQIYNTAVNAFSSILNLISGTNAYIGFTGSTGGMDARHEILSVSYAQTITPFTNGGCYVDQSSRLLGDNAYTSTSMTIESCASHCAGYTYFGVEYGIECYCGNSIQGGIEVDQSECNIVCSGDNTEKCGGNWRENIYLAPPAPTTAAPTTAAPAPSVPGTCTAVSSNVDLVGNAYTGSSSFVLTDPTYNERGALWIDTPINVTDDFTVQFNFKLTHQPDPSNTNCNTPPALGTADGVVFVINPNSKTAIGNIAESIAYDITNTFAVEFDSYQNNDLSDPAGFHIGVQSCGTGQNNANHAGPCAVAPPVTVTNQCFDNVAHTAVISYVAATGILSVSLDGTTYQTVSVSFKTLLSLINGDSAYIGFTSSTGGQFARQEVSAITYSCRIPVAPTTAAPTPAPVCTLANTPAAQIVTVGNAAYDSTAGSYVLTTPDLNEQGAVWINNTIDVTKAFEVSFGFKLTHSPSTATACSSPYTSKGTADGIAFVINANSASALGGVAQTLAYNIANTLAVEFDSYPNDDYSDPTYPHVAVQSCGQNQNSADHGGNCAIQTPAAFPNNCFDYVSHTAKFTYDGSSIIKVYMDSTLVTSVTYSLSNLQLIGGTSAYIGFTGATGGQYSRQEVTSATFPCA